jgi:hypothetical protein
MKKHFILTALLLVFHLLCNAQNKATMTLIDDDTTKYDGKWMMERTFFALKSMKLVYNKPHHFNEVNGWECFKKNPKFIQQVY